MTSLTRKLFSSYSNFFKSFLQMIIILSVFSSCKSQEPIGVQVAKPIDIGFVKGPGVLSAGKLYFMEEVAVYRPYKWYFINFQKVRTFPYADIDTVERSKLFGVIPVIANLKMKHGKKYKIRMYYQRNLDSTLNNLKQ